MKQQTAKLEGIALDYAVALAEGGENFWFDTIASYWMTINGEDRVLKPNWAQSFTPATNWSFGGPIIEREKIMLDCASSHGPWEGSCKIDGVTGWVEGPTPLIAAMRCYVASKLGDEVEIPEELLA